MFPSFALLSDGGTTLVSALTQRLRFSRSAADILSNAEDTGRNFLKLDSHIELARGSISSPDPAQHIN